MEYIPGSTLTCRTSASREVPALKALLSQASRPIPADTRHRCRWNAGLWEAQPGHCLLSCFRRSDPERPSGISIDDGADFANSPRVRLWLGWEGLVDRVKVSNDGGFAPSKTREIKLRERGPLDWTLVELAAERIPRTVYVKYHYVESGWQKQTYSDDIILDTVKPEVVSASLGGSGTATLAAAKRTLRVRAKDNKSGIASMQVSVGKPKKKAKVVTFRKAVKVAGAGRVFVRVRDGAGNWSQWRSAV